MLVYIKCTYFYNNLKFRNKGEDGKVLTCLTSSPWLLSSMTLACLLQLLKHYQYILPKVHTLFRFLQFFLVFFLHFRIPSHYFFLKGIWLWQVHRVSLFSKTEEKMGNIWEVFSIALGCFMTRLGLWVWGREILETEHHSYTVLSV